MKYIPTKEETIEKLQAILGKHRYLVKNNSVDLLYTNIEVIDVENYHTKDFVIKIKGTRLGFVYVKDGVSIRTFMEYLSPQNRQRIRYDDEKSKIYKHMVRRHPSLLYLVLYPFLWFLTITMYKFRGIRTEMIPGNYYTGETFENEIFTLTKAEVARINLKSDIEESGVRIVFDD